MEPAIGCTGLLLAGYEGSAQLLGVNRARVRQLVAAGLLPSEATPHGYAFRRQQLLTVANARRARFHSYDIGDGREAVT
jgi:hypothetical protein